MLFPRSIATPARLRRAATWGLGLYAFTASCVIHSPKVASPSPSAATQVLEKLPAEEHKRWIAQNYEKSQHRVAMRDGVELWTTVYRPKAQREPLPILFFRTPYSTGPYQADEMPSKIGPSALITKSGYIFVHQDVRGAFMSQGEFVNMRPQLDPQAPRSVKDIDESTDTYDSIEWMMKNVPNHNGKVGMWGISYPGFYAAAGMINAHPALAAVSPQAPIADWYFDDFHHHGAFFLPHAFNFLSSFGQARPKPRKDWPKGIKHGTKDGYAFFKRMGPLSNANKKYLHGKIDFWNKIVEHPNRDEFWQSRDILPHLKKTAPAVMTVGGWFDAEDLYGPLKIYATNERNNPENFNVLVMGPWVHGGWARSTGRSLGQMDFGADTASYYQEKIEKPFFDHFLKGQGQHQLPEAMVFETGSNRWRSFPSWPPQGKPKSLFLGEGGQIMGTAPTAEQGFDSFISDPASPVPSSQIVSIGMPRPYMTEDQRFASRRPDVLSYQTPLLYNALTLAGEIEVDLWVSTSQQDADWVVKLIDVLPPDHIEPGEHPDSASSEAHRMIRSEVFRGRFREGYDKARPFLPNTPTRVRFPLQDILHTFKKGHRLMIQIQSTWFPMVDRNPQKWVENIFKAQESDFQKAEHRVYFDKAHPSSIRVRQLSPGAGEASRN